MSFARIQPFLFASCLAGLLAVPASAQSVGPYRPPAAAPRAASAPPLRLAERMSPAPLVALRSATEGAADQLAALGLWNRTRHVPQRVGFSRPLPSAQKVVLGTLAPGTAPAQKAGGFVARSAAGGTVWSTSVQVAGAYRLRLHLAAVELPATAQLWVWGRGEEPHAFGVELRGPDGGLWTPGVAGDTVYLEIEVPATAAAANPARFVPDAVSQAFQLDTRGQPITGVLAPRLGECVIDATCVNPATFAPITLLRDAVGLLDFIDAGGEFLCSGGLLNDTASDGVPYMLTANHCFDNQSAASSLEVFWNFRSTTCNGDAPDLSTLPMSEGSTLLATDPTSDFTFVRLTSVPGGQAFLGWDAGTSAVANGTHLFRVSQAFGDKQVYSTSTLHTSGIPVCDGAPRPDFLYGTGTQGATFEGSSGSPAVLADGSVVGQLLGGCGVNNPDDGCDYSNSEIDGAFSVTYPKIAQYLNAVTHVPPAPCVPGLATLCLSGGRFQVDATYDAGSGQSGAARTVSLTDASGYLWFFDATNVEAVVKVLDGCAVGGHYWVFSGGLTNINVALRVIDTLNGTVRMYINPQGTAFQPIQDTSAFATCP